MEYSIPSPLLLHGLSRWGASYWVHYSVPSRGEIMNIPYTKAETNRMAYEMAVMLLEDDRNYKDTSANREAYERRKAARGLEALRREQESETL